MTIVSNTSPLCYLTREALFDRAAIPHHETALPHDDFRGGDHKDRFRHHDFRTPFVSGMLAIRVAPAVGNHTSGDREQGDDTA
jgi:hypothetical protein